MLCVSGISENLDSVYIEPTREVREIRELRAKRARARLFEKVTLRKSAKRRFHAGKAGATIRNVNSFLYIHFV